MKRTGRKVLQGCLSILMSMAMIIGMLPMAGRRAKAAESGNTVFKIAEGNVNIVVDSTGTTVRGNAFTGDEIVIEGDKDTAVENTISIDVGENLAVTVVLRNVNINVSGIDDLAAVLIQGEGNVTIKLEGESTVDSGENCAGIQKESTGELIITASKETESLSATGGEKGAGIGGGGEGNGSYITIGGKAVVSATGGENGAGIGGGYDGDGLYIIIEGDAKVLATGTVGGAGIGGGYDGNGTNISITGGMVTAISEKNDYVRSGGAGIGGGENTNYRHSGSGTNISITGGTVTAIGGNGGGAGIGGGLDGNGSYITIGGNANVKATGGSAGAGIGSGRRYKQGGSGTNITISGGEVTATGKDGGAGIGGGYESEGSNITITGGTVVAEGGNGGAGIGGGVDGNGSHINIEGNANVKATGGDCGAGIGGGQNYRDYGGGSGTNITISGGTIEATGGEGGAGIGGGSGGSGSGITVDGEADVTAKGGTAGAGIGGGSGGSGNDITFTDGTVTATGKDGGAGIGGGMEGAGSNITITGGTVTAIGKDGGAGIGGGWSAYNGSGEGSGSEITIGGDAEVIASGGSCAAGIGGGQYSNGSKFTITGNAVVKAAGGISGYSGAAIGQGMRCDAVMDYDGAESIITTITKESSGLDGQVWRYPAGTSAEKMAEDVENKMDGAERVEKATIMFHSNYGNSIGEFAGKDLTPGNDTFPEDLFRNEGYAIASWNTDPNGNGDSYLPGDVVTFIGRITLYAQWTKLYNVTVKNGKATDKNNKEITQAIKGAAVTVTAATPDEGKAFNEWSCDDKTVTFAVNNSFETTFVMPEGEVNVEAVIRDITITDLEESYTYTAAEIKPNVTVGFEGVDIRLKEDEYAISYKDNVKPGTASVTVTINKPRAGSKTVTFKITGNTVRWLDGDDSVLEEAYYTTDMPSYSKNITPTGKEQTGHIITFAGWDDGTVKDSEYGKVTEYRPLFSDELETYTVTFVDEDGTTLKEYTVKYGDKPAYDGEEPSKQEDELYDYTFSGWKPAIAAATGDATYKATYTGSEHLYDAEVVDDKYLKSAADCTHKAVYYKSCGECGGKGTETFEYGEALGHDYKVVEGSAVAPTCTKAGKEADLKCSSCGGVITGKEIAATGHTFDQEVVDEKYLKSAADCTNAAVYYKSCKCGEKSADGKDVFSDGEALGHDYKTVDGSAVTPTCTKAGKDADQKCSRCDAVITGKEIAATGHTFDQEVVDAKYLKSAADCITAAVYFKSCKCGEKSTNEKDIFTYGEPVGHKWKAATGYAPKTCEVCGLEEGQKVTYDPITGQVFIWTKGSKEPFVLTIKRSQDDVNCFLHYLNTLLDGVEIKVESRSGSTIITIPAETLELLTVGDHLITVVFDDWKADFTLTIAAPVDTSPATGDENHVFVYTVIMMLAALATGVVVWKKRRSAA